MRNEQEQARLKETYRLIEKAQAGDREMCIRDSSYQG